MKIPRLSRLPLRAQLRAWREESLGGVCHAHDAGVFGGSDAAALLRFVSGRVGEAWQQAPVVGAHALAVLYLRTGIYASTARSPVLRLEKAQTHLCD